MAGTTGSVEEVLAELLTLVLPKIGRYPKTEALIELHWLISGNVASVASKLGGGWQRHLALKTTVEDDM